MPNFNLIRQLIELFRCIYTDGSNDSALYGKIPVLWLFAYDFKSYFRFPIVTNHFHFSSPFTAPRTPITTHRGHTCNIYQSTRTTKSPLYIRQNQKTTYVPSNSFRWYFSSICLSGSRASFFDFFESFLPKSGILCGLRLYRYKYYKYFFGFLLFGYTSNENKIKKLNKLKHYTTLDTHSLYIRFGSHWFFRLHGYRFREIVFIYQFCVLWIMYILWLLLLFYSLNVKNITQHQWK